MVIFRCFHILVKILYNSCNFDRKLFGSECLWFQDEKSSKKSRKKRKANHDSSTSSLASSEEETAQIIVHVRTLTGKHITFKNVDRGITVLRLKELIQDAEGVPPDQSRIIMRCISKKLENDKTLRFYNVQNGDILDHALKLSGC